jgi:hypothetical protein
VTKDGIYIESGFKNDKPCGKVLIIKPNGTYFEGNIDKPGTQQAAKDGQKSKDKIRGIFRNPVLKRQSMIQKDPDRSKRMCFGKNVYGYAYMEDDTRYKGVLSKGKLL